MRAYFRFTLLGIKLAYIFRVVYFWLPLELYTNIGWTFAFKIASIKCKQLSENRHAIHWKFHWYQTNAYVYKFLVAYKIFARNFRFKSVFRFICLFLICCVVSPLKKIKKNGEYTCTEMCKIRKLCISEEALKKGIAYNLHMLKLKWANSLFLCYQQRYFVVGIVHSFSKHVHSYTKIKVIAIRSKEPGMHKLKNSNYFSSNGHHNFFAFSIRIFFVRRCKNRKSSSKTKTKKSSLSRS